MLVKKKLEFFRNCPQNSSNLKLNSKSRFESPRTQIYRYKITLSLLSHMVSDIKKKKIVKFFFFFSCSGSGAMKFIVASPDLPVTSVYFLFGTENNEADFFLLYILLDLFSIDPYRDRYLSSR